MTAVGPGTRDLNSLQTRDDGICVIARAAQILRALECAPQGLTRTDLAYRVGMSVSTVKRIVDSLINEQLLIAASPTSGVCLGPALIRLGQSTPRRNGELIQPTLVALARELGESVILATASGNNSVVIKELVCTQRLAARFPPGTSAPLHSNASGKVLLSTLCESSLERYLAGPSMRLTQNTIVDPARLRKELKAIRIKGIAVDAEEHVEGIGSLAIAFKDELGQIAALSVPLPVPRFGHLRKSVARRLVEVKAQIEWIQPESTHRSGG